MQVPTDKLEVAPRAYAKFYTLAEPYIDGSFVESNVGETLVQNYLNFYVFSRIAWYGRTDVEALLEEHHRLMFGEKAAGPMGRFYTILEKKWVREIVGNTIDISQNGTLNLSNTVYGTATRFADKGGNSIAAVASDLAIMDLYVDPAVEEGGDGSEGSPFRTLGAAVAACTDATVIHLAEGMYTEETCPIDFTGLRHVKVVGAGRDETVVSGGRTLGPFAAGPDGFFGSIVAATTVSVPVGKLSA
mgnify:CR=1 FL=1